MVYRKIKIAAVLILSLVLLSGCSLAGITRGNGNMINDSFSYDGEILKIEASVPATFNIVPENKSEVTYTIDENLKDLLDITYQNGVLKIAVKDNKSISSNKIKFNIGSESLEEIIVNGAADIKGSGTFDAETFKMTISGAGSAELALNAQSVSAQVSGAGDIDLSGTTDELNINVSGAADINTRNLIAQNAVIDLSGAGSAKIYAENTLKVSVSGAGSVTYWGDPELTKSTSGAATIKKGD